MIAYNGGLFYDCLASEASKAGDGGTAMAGRGGINAVNGSGCMGKPVRKEPGAGAQCDGR